MPADVRTLFTFTIRTVHHGRFKRSAEFLDRTTIPSPEGRHLAMVIYTDDSNVYTMDEF